MENTCADNVRLARSDDGREFTLVWIATHSRISLELRLLDQAGDREAAPLGQFRTGEGLLVVPLKAEGEFLIVPLNLVVKTEAALAA